MNVLVFSSLYPNSAQPRHGIFVEQRVRRLHESGVGVEVLAPVPWFPSSHPRFGAYARIAQAPEADTRHGIDVRYPRFPVVPRVGMTLAPFLMAAAMLPVVKRRAAQRRIDIIDAHYFYPDGVAAVWLGRQLGVPVTVTARGSDINVIGGYRLPRRMILWAARNAAASITVSAALRDRLAGLGADRSRVQVLRNGVDLALFYPETSDTEQLLAPDTLLSVGNLTENKGHHLVVEALPLLPGKRLVIVGDGPMRGTLEQRAVALGVADRMQIMGVVSQETLRTLYASAAMLVLASASEGMPNVVLESLACGTPVVATPVGGIPEVLAADEAGVLMPERTAGAIANAVRQLDLRQPPAAAVRAFAEQFGWADITSQQIALFERICAGNV